MFYELPTEDKITFIFLGEFIRIPNANERKSILMADPGEKETGYVFCDFFVNEFLAQALILANHALAEEEFQEEYLFRNN